MKKNNLIVSVGIVMALFYAQNVAAQGGQKWSVNGNGVNGNNFLGTTNNQDLILKSNGVEGMRLQPNGNVGIGTTTPAATLDVAGSFRFSNGTEQTGYFLGTDANGNATWLPLPTQPTIWQQVSNNAFYLSGNVGIGTDTPSQALDISNGRIQIENSGFGASVIMNRTDGKSGTMIAGQTGVGMLVDNTADFSIIHATEANVLSGNGNGTTRFKIATDGNVGIGTAAPYAPLTVIKDLGVAVGKHFLSSYVKGSPSTTNAGFSVGYEGNGSAVSENFVRFSGEHPASIRLHDSNLGGDRAVLWLESDGKVGINTSSPGEMLSVGGTIESTSGGIKFPDGTVQTSAAAAQLGTQSNPFTEMYATDFIKVGSNSLWLGTVDLGVSEEIFSTDNSLVINGLNSANTAGGVQNTFINPDDGRVGIGTEVASYKLHLHDEFAVVGGPGGQTEGYMHFTNSNTGEALGDGMKIGMRGNAGYVTVMENSLLHLGTNNTSQVTIGPNGDTEFKGNIFGSRTNGSFQIYSNTNSTNGSYINMHGNGSFKPGTVVMVAGAGNANGAGDIEFFTGSDLQMQIRDNGKVSIGDEVIFGGPHFNYRLSVDGKIVSKEVVVTLDNWADYVFEPGYELPTLKEVSSFIDENGHLPGVPSREHVLEEGLNVGDMNEVMMKKIEELTLYIIKLEDKCDELNGKVNALESK
jgi:hypothetical protein